MDLDAFECPICASIFEGPIFQCKNGHVVCDTCRVRINGTCPSCREPVGDIRCRALEKAIAGMAVPCAFSSRGCAQVLKLREKRDHEAFRCQHAPFACPFQDCAYSAASAAVLHDHVQDAHTVDSEDTFSAAVSEWWVWLHRRSGPVEVLRDKVERRVFLLLNGGDVRSGGRSLSVVCLGARPAADRSLEYKLEVGGDAIAGEPPGALSLSAAGSVPCIRSWTGQYPTDGFLFVPDAYWKTSLACVVVKVHVNHVRVLDRLASSVRRHYASLELIDLLLVVMFVFVFSAMAVVSAYAWKTSSIGKKLVAFLQ